MYGQELIIDMKGCSVSQFNRDSLEEYFKQLCKLIDMKRCDLHFWDDLDTPEEEKQTEPHTKGTTAVQFILTSNITIHTLDMLKEVYVNIFSCKYFDKGIALSFTRRWFGAKEFNSSLIKRGEWELHNKPEPPQIRDLKEGEQPTR